jgi:hypothetical protein
MPHVENGKNGEGRGNGDPLEDGDGILERGVAPKTAVETESGESQRLKHSNYEQTIPKKRMLLARDTKIKAEQEGKKQGCTDQGNITEKNYDPFVF